MRTAAQWLDDYGDSHRHHVNKALHWICVPVIAWCVVGLLWLLPFPAGLRSLHPAVKEKPGRKPFSEVKKMKDDPVAVEKLSGEIKAHYSKLFGV